MNTMNDPTTNTITVSHQDEIKKFMSALDDVKSNMKVIEDSLNKIEGELGMCPVKVKMNKEGRVKMVMDTHHLVALTAILHRVRLGGHSCYSESVFDLVSEIEKFLPEYNLEEKVDDACDLITATNEEGDAVIYNPTIEFNV